MSRDASTAVADSSRRGESMRSEKERAVKRDVLHPLTKSEIDRRIESLMAEIAAGSGTEAKAASSQRAERPRWITAREFVERVRPFLVYN